MRRNSRRDDGFTLIELLVSSLLVSVVVLVVGGIIMSSYRAESTVRSVTTSTTDAQLAVNLMESTVRQASAVRVTTAPGESQLAQLRVVGPAGVTCVSWYYHAATTALYERRAASMVPAPTPSTEPPSGWSLLVDGVTASQGSAVLVGAGAQSLELRILKSTDTARSTVISTTMSGRVPLMESSPRCFD